MGLFERVWKKMKEFERILSFYLIALCVSKCFWWLNTAKTTTNKVGDGYDSTNLINKMLCNEHTNKIKQMNVIIFIIIVIENTE